MFASRWIIIHPSLCGWVCVGVWVLFVGGDQCVVVVQMLWCMWCVGLKIKEMFVHMLLHRLLWHCRTQQSPQRRSQMKRKKRQHRWVWQYLTVTVMQHKLSTVTCNIRCLSRIQCLLPASRQVK